MAQLKVFRYRVAGLADANGQVAGQLLSAPLVRVTLVPVAVADGSDPDLPGTGHGIGHVLKDQPVKTAMLPDQDGAHRGPPAPTPGPRRR